MSGYEQNAQLYIENVFPKIALWMIFTPLATAFIFYILMNGFRFAKFISGSSRWSKVWIWLIFMLLTALAVGSMTVLKSEEITQQFFSDDSYIQFLSIWNAFLSAVFFFLYSLIFKKLSIHAKHIPF
jgi:hypothetical protein